MPSMFSSLYMSIHVSTVIFLCDVRYLIDVICLSQIIVDIDVAWIMDVHDIPWTISTIIH